MFETAGVASGRAGGFFMAMDGRYAENAGAIFGGCLDGYYPKKRNVRRKCGEQFSAGA